MNQPQYDLEISTAGDVYEFGSVGVRGVIPKMIRYSPTVNPSLYNLAFGNRVETVSSNGSVVVTLDDEDDSRNGDAEKVIATVVASVYDYTSRYPERQIFFQGSDERRTRGYRLAITRHYEDLQTDFHIFGIIEANGDFQAVSFDSGTRFTGYLVYRKPQPAMKKGVLSEADSPAYEKKLEASHAASGNTAKITVNKELDKLSGQVLAPKKLEEANRIIARLRLD